MGKKIAIIFNGNVQDRKGYVNAVLERAKRLYAQGEYSVDVFCISQYDHWLVRQLRHSERVIRQAKVVVDGMLINMIWYPFSLIDYFLSVKLRTKKLIEPLLTKRILHCFEGYDLIIAHSTTSGVIALNVKNKYRIPYTITWHGSDIHTEPFINHSYKQLVIKVIESAAVNMFVSQKLRDTAQQIYPNIVDSYVSYNGASDIFYKYGDEEKCHIREQYRLTREDKVVGFVGGLVPIKNVDILPEIFNKINEVCPSVKFWIIGDGKLRKNIEFKLQEKYPMINCTMFGNQSVKVMPDIMNCLDLLLLPSQNEGLPLVIVEALRCATNVVAADVGGIKEVIGDKNAIDHGDGFIERFAQRCTEILINNESCPKLPEQFDWDIIVKNELMLYKSILQIQ